MYWVPLISASPSFASSTTGAIPAAFKRLGSRERAAPSELRLAFADHREREMRERREVARGADRALRRDARVHLRVEHRDERVDEERAHARMTEREHLRAQEDHPAHLGRREARPTPVEWERTRFRWSVRMSAAEIRVSLSAPNPVFTP